MEFVTSYVITCRYLNIATNFTYSLDKVMDLYQVVNIHDPIKGVTSTNNWG